LDILNLIKKPVQSLFLNFGPTDSIRLHQGFAQLNDCAVILLFCIKHPAELKSVEAIIPVAKKYFKKVVALVLYTGIKKPPISTEEVRVVSIKDFTLFGKPNVGLLEYTPGNEADILISMKGCESGYFKKLVKHIPAGFKAGIYQSSIASLFHFMLQVDSRNLSDEMVLEQFVVYIKKIKPLSHE
jgi:hypothetical protein